MAKNPILLFKDPWDRWAALGEIDYQKPGGCGKPVIYLYPTVSTDITVQFVNAMKFDADIPTYSGEWHILAKPDGQLTDLQPSHTDCATIDYTRIGSEYAKDACANNNYPYLYWAGNTVGTYPTPTGGWVIPKDNITSFLDEKLTEAGLNQKEKTDMMSYWLPELLNKNAPYYRISFFQTQQMDEFIPMKVTPSPDTVIRVFLDWSPLTTLPTVLPQPQKLTSVVRKGFTLVEWGGLKQ